MFGSAVGREEFNTLYNNFTKFVEIHGAALKAIEPLIGIMKQLQDEQTRMNHNLELQERQITLLQDQIDVLQRLIGTIDTIAREVDRLSSFTER
jgi:hypothetical protein